MIVVSVHVTRDLISKEWHKYKKEDHSIDDLITLIEASLMELLEEDL
jgi:hypothetical protein